MTSFISSSWIKPLWKKLNAIRGERTQEIQRIENTFVDPYDLARFYVEPNCQHHNPADHQEDKESRSMVKSPVFRTINDFLEGNYAVTEGGKNQMFILSDAGMGKTSLLVMLKLTHLTRFWPSQYHCKLLKLGADTMARVKAMSAAGDTVLLLDALDEDPTAWGKIGERLLEILTHTSHFRRVIISCRTQFFPETSTDSFANPGRVKLGGFVCPMIFLSLFDSTQVKEYLAKRYPDSWVHWFKANRKREQAQLLVEKMKDLSCRPMLVAHIEDLVESSIKDWDEYGVYSALVEAWLDREERKLHKQGRDDITASVLFRACLLVAEQMHRSGSRFLSETQLNELLVQHPECTPLTEINFGGRSLLNRNAEGDYRFSHFSIQEFLTARQILRAATSELTLEVPKFATEKIIRFVLDGRAKTCPNKRLVMSKLNLARFDLARFNLHDCDFSESDLSGADLSGADLSGANLFKANLAGANLAGANLTKVNLVGAFLTQPLEEQSFVLPINDVVKIEFVWIPPGSFYMGKTKVRVTLSRGFWMCKYPVTQGQYEALIGKNPSHHKMSGLDAPVEQVSWHEAVTFGVRLCRRLRNAGGSWGLEVRLPTEAEWEYACRAGSTGEFCFGDDQTKLGEYAWFDGNSGARTQRVGQKKPNEWGLYDMHGNVYEWCQDWFAEENYEPGPKLDPEGPKTGWNRVVRGGAYFVEAFLLSSAYRGWDYPDSGISCVGFRCVLVRSGSAEPSGADSFEINF